MSVDQDKEFEFRLRLEQEQSSNPQPSNIENFQEEQKPPESFSDIIKKAAKRSLLDPVVKTKDLATNPVTMAKALPYVASTTGAVALPWGGSTAGYAVGRGISDIALKVMGKEDQIPSALQQSAELGGSILSDVIPIPLAKKSIFGKQIGNAEKSAGVVTRAPDKLPTSVTVGETLNNLEAQLNSGAISDPQTARDAYAVANYITGNPNLLGKSKEITVQATRVRQLAQQTLNKLIPSRLEPAMEMAKSQTIPRAIGKLPGVGLWGPWAARGAGVAAGGTAAAELVKRLFGR